MALFVKGFTFSYGGLTYQKIDHQYVGTWTCLNSKYVLEIKGKDGKTRDILRPESDKPLERRFGFKWTDDQVKEYFKL